MIITPTVTKIDPTTACQQSGSPIKVARKTTKTIENRSNATTRKTGARFNARKYTSHESTPHILDNTINRKERELIVWMRGNLFVKLAIKNKKTTIKIVRTNVAVIVSIWVIPILLKIATKAAKNADNSPKNIHETFSIISVPLLFPV